MTSPEIAKEVAKKADRWSGILTIASGILFVWSLFPLELRKDDPGLIGFLAAVDKNVVAPILMFVIVLASWRRFVWSGSPSRTSERPLFRRSIDLAVTYLFGLTAIAANLSALKWPELWAEIRRSPICLIFASAGWMLVIPTGYALARSRSEIVKSQGLATMAPVILTVGLLAIWVSVSIAGMSWPVWLGIWLGFIPGVMIILAWRSR